MAEKLKRLLAFWLLFHTVAGLAIIVALALGPPLVLGAGRFEELVLAFEGFNFKWWFVSFSVVIWVPPIAITVLWMRVKAAGVEMDQIRAHFKGLLEDRIVPVTVEIDERIAVRCEDELQVRVDLSTMIDLDSDMEITAQLPIRAQMPLDTTIQTSVLGVGKISIPIKGMVPLDFMLPIDGKLRIKAAGVPISINELSKIQLPTFEIPLQCRIETQVDLLSTFEHAGIQKRPHPVDQAGDA